MTTMLTIAVWLGAVAQDPDTTTRPRPAPTTVEEALRRDRVMHPIPPAGRDLGGSTSPMEALRAHLTEKARLWPEGATLALRRGRIELADEPRFVFTDAAEGDAGREMVLLANSKLDQMENYVAAAPDREIEFRVIGSVTEYRGANYLLLREVDIVNTPPRTSPPGGSAQSPAAGARSDVIDVLLEEAETVEPLPPTANKPARRSAARRESTARWPEDTQVVSRVGRIVEDGGAWQFIFESASERPADPPVTMLRNLALQSMIEMSDAGRLGVVFVVSGDITEYESENFMLVRRFSLRRDDGNLQ